MVHTVINHGEIVDHLVIPDSHAHPDKDPMERYKSLGKYIIEHKPKVIINIGDWWEMGSLCHYEKGKKDYVFKNIKDDIEAGHEAEQLAFGPIVEHNKKLTRWKMKQYRPVIVKVLGNHEARVKTLLEYEPRLEGTISMDDFATRLDLKEHIVPFQSVAVVDGIAYSHYFTSGTMGRPVSSARAMVMKKHTSCTMGHTHLLDIHTDTKPTGTRVRGLICGSFHEPNYESFAGPQTDTMWWNGLVHKHNVMNGDYDFSEISVERLITNYS